GIVPTRDAFREGLRDLGYIEGQNLVVEWRSTNGSEDRLLELAAELTQLPVELIVTSAAPATRAAQQATATIPIVFIMVTDPVGLGFVPSLARPGGNITGLTDLSAPLSMKRLELLHDAVPGLSRAVALWDPSNPG